MPKQIECRIIESRPLVPCHALSHRQPDNNRRDDFANPSRPQPRQKVQAIRMGFFSSNIKPRLGEQSAYPLGLMVDTLA